jgi:hypothetical protein
MSDESWVMAVYDSTDTAAMAVASAMGNLDNPRLWLLSYDPDGRRGMGSIHFTDSVDEAKRYDSAHAVLEEWRRQSGVRPMRPDGKPNRPLTAYSISPQRVA